MSVKTGANGNPDVEHHQNVRLDLTVQQKCRQVHQMCQFYMRIGRKYSNLPKEFFSQDQMKKFHEEVKGFLKKNEPTKVLKELGARASPDNFKKYLVTVWNNFLTTCEPGELWGTCAVAFKSDLNPPRPDLMNNPEEPFRGDARDILEKTISSMTTSTW